jgi:hypothetical protein
MMILTVLLMSTGGFQSAASPQWEPVPLVSPQQRAAGFKGGEGGQWPRSLAIDSTGKNLILGIDVGGVYRSQDGGLNWEQAGVGFTPRGCLGVAFDPKNSRRILAVGVNTAMLDRHGIYLSEDGGSSWRNTLAQTMAGVDDFRDQIAFDVASYDSAKNETRTVFWARIKNDHANFGSVEQNPGFFRSLDGGRNWEKLADLTRLSGAILKADPRGGSVLAGTEEGLFRLDSQSLKTVKLADGAITGLDALGSSIWLTTKSEVKVSNSRGQSWTTLPSQSIVRPDATLRHIKVSPADPKRLMLWSDQSPSGWDWPRWISHDGGQTWMKAAKVSEGAFLPDNSRQGIGGWHPANPNTAWSLGGDWATMSTDGGRSFRYSSQGINGVLVGGMWSFSLSDPNLIFFGSQDYNGAVTTDAGRTWTYTNIAGLEWGGFCYGGYAASRSLLFAGNAAGWGAPRHLKVSTDLGKTWKDTGHEIKGKDSGYGFPGKPDIAFAGDMRTQDGGKTWARMVGCSGVYTHSPQGELFGLLEGSPRRVVSSKDQGRTWTALGETPDEVMDLAWDPVGKRLFVAVNLELRTLANGVWTKVNLPLDQFQSTRVRTVAVDPVDPKVIYAGAAANIYSTSHSVYRSLDGGRTWQSMTRAAPLDGTGRDGGREALCSRVHPKSRWLYVSTSCYGIWKLPPP